MTGKERAFLVIGSRLGRPRQMRGIERRWDEEKEEKGWKPGEVDGVKIGCTLCASGFRVVLHCC
jgi:hypothetical protein